MEPRSEIPESRGAHFQKLGAPFSEAKRPLQKSSMLLSMCPLQKPSAPTSARQKLPSVFPPPSRHTASARASSTREVRAGKRSQLLEIFAHALLRNPLFYELIVALIAILL